MCFARVVYVSSGKVGQDADLSLSNKVFDYNQVRMHSINTALRTFKSNYGKDFS